MALVGVRAVVTPTLPPLCEDIRHAPASAFRTAPRSRLGQSWESMGRRSGIGMSGPALVRQGADASLAAAWAEVVADVDGGQVRATFAE
jgi:hypothetical protein